MHRHTRPALLSLGLLLLLGLSFVVPLPDGGVRAANLGYLGAARSALGSEIAEITGVLAFVEVLSTASIGLDIVVKADLEIGQALAVLAAMTERALAGGLFAALLIDLWQLLLDATRAAAPWFLRAALLFGALDALMRTGGWAAGVAPTVLRAAALSAMGFILAFLVLPYGTNAVAALSCKALGSLPHAGVASFADLANDLRASDASSDPLGYWSSGESSRAALERAVTDLPQKTDMIRRTAVERLAFTLFVGLIGPMVILSVLGWLALRLARDIWAEIDRIVHAETAALAPAPLEGATAVKPAAPGSGQRLSA